MLGRSCSISQSLLRDTLQLETYIVSYSGKESCLLYRHECLTGKYTTHKIHKNYIRDPSGLFFSLTREFIDEVILLIFLYYFIDVILSI